MSNKQGCKQHLQILSKLETDITSIRIAQMEDENPTVS